jgi:hypothetical protein
MRQLLKNELISVASAGCSPCQQKMANNVAMFNGTLLGMAGGWAAYALSTSMPVAISTGILTFAGVAYYSYHNAMDSFIN